MRTSLAICLIAALRVMPSLLAADDPVSVCKAMVTNAAHNISVDNDESQFLNTTFYTYCRQDGSTKQSSYDASIAAVIDEIPTNFGGGATDAQAAFTSFCSLYKSKVTGSSADYSKQITVLASTLKSADQCLGIVSKANVAIIDTIHQPKSVAIQFTLGDLGSIQIRGLSHEAQVTCQGANLAPGGGVIDYNAGVPQTLPPQSLSYSILCTRAPSQTVNGLSQYAATFLLLDTNAGPLNVDWPADATLPLTDANQIQAALTDLGGRIAATTDMAKSSQDKLSTIVLNYERPVPSQAAIGFQVDAKAQIPILQTNEVHCPSGQYLAGLQLGWSGTCKGACDGNGGILHAITPICKPLF